MKIIGVIPTRLESKRFPRKLLQKINGKTILQLTYEQARKALDHVIIATESKEIEKIGTDIGAEVFFDERPYYSGLERVYGAVVNKKCDIVVNIQADEPFISPNTIREAIDGLDRYEGIMMSTPIVEIIAYGDEWEDPNTVKVVTDDKGYALYFSRSPIPYHANKVHKHVGVYVYKKHFLKEIAGMPMGVLEQVEGLEQLRVLENGYKIFTVKVEDNCKSINIPEDVGIRCQICNRVLYGKDGLTDRGCIWCDYEWHYKGEKI